LNAQIRRARLRGTREAERILKILDVRPRLSSTDERVDVFDALAWLDVHVIFRPLQGLLGAYMRGAQPGAMISTNRPLSVQRFTAAHELGHAILEHEPSLDSPDVLRRAASDQFRPKMNGFASYLQEIEADAFASAFLLPMWLITHHARRQNWSRSSLSVPETVYQLSLRCGASFQATVWALDRNQIISTDNRVTLLGIKPKEIKGRLGHRPPAVKTRADAWNLTLGDTAGTIPIAVGDSVTVSLTQESGGGYLWRSLQTPEAFKELDRSTLIEAPQIGGASLRSVLLRADAAGNFELAFEHRRPWEQDAIANAHFPICVSEPELGLSRANRRRMLDQAQLRRRSDSSHV